MYVCGGVCGGEGGGGGMRVCMYVCACACVCVCVLHVRACMHSSNKMKLQGDESGLGSILVEGSEHNPFCNRRNVIVMDN